MLTGLPGGKLQKNSVNPQFICPDDGPLTQSMVNFVCNTCHGTDVIEVNGMYVCPDCLKSSEPFECRLCGSKEIVFSSKIFESKD